MDKYKVKVNPRAIRELDHIYEYIANEKLAPENAKGQVERIKKAVLGLDTFPPQLYLDKTPVNGLQSLHIISTWKRISTDRKHPRERA